MEKQKKVIYFLLFLVVLAWGLEYVFAKNILEAFTPLTLIFAKYFISSIILLIIRLKKEGYRKIFQRKNFLALVIAAVFGEIVCFYCEYTALDYLPVSIITIFLALVPVVSLILERVIYGRKINLILFGGVVFSIVGIAMIIGEDIDKLLSGKLTGYILVIIAVIFWNLYNFITEAIQTNYTALTLSLNQQIICIVILLPYMLTHLPDVEKIDTTIMMKLLFVAVFCAALGFVIYVKALAVVGVTPTALSINFIPLSSTFFGWLILKETIAPIQALGGVIVIISATMVIYQKEKLAKETKGELRGE